MTENISVPVHKPGDHCKADRKSFRITKGGNLVYKCAECGHWFWREVKENLG